MPKTLTQKEFLNMFHNFESRAFRLEMLDNYSIEEEADELKRFYLGEPLPVLQNIEWCSLVRAAGRANKTMTRVHVVTFPLSSYLQYEINWGYVFSVDAGENIYIIDRAKVAQEFLDNTSDFWIFDEKVLVELRYDSDGKFLETVLIDDPASIEDHIRIQEKLLATATPLKDFLRQLRAK